MNNNIFVTLTSEQMADAIRMSSKRVLIAAPGIAVSVAHAVRHYNHYATSGPTVILDCDDDVCRIGYGEVNAIRMLIDAGIEVRQCTGLRIGVLICDDVAWSFSPVPLSVEEEPCSGAMPNAIRLTRAQAEAIVDALVSRPPEPESLFQPEPEIGVEPVSIHHLADVERNLVEAPPIRFDLQRKVRVFQPYIQYVELALTGCSITRHTVNLPNEIVNLATDPNLRERIQTRFALIDDASDLSDKPLQDELTQIRNNYTRALGKPWGRVMLRNQREAIDKRLAELATKLKAFEKRIIATLSEEIEKSISQLIEVFLPNVCENPPDELLGQIQSHRPDANQTQVWLRSKLTRAFPKVEQLTSKMKLECIYKDVTFESLTHPGLSAALKEAYPTIQWEKLFEEFDAVTERES